MTTTTITIECIDEGFIITQDRKRRAIEKSTQVDEMLKELICDLTKRKDNNNVRELVVSITIDENPAKPA